MTYPILITDEPHLLRLIRQVVKETRHEDVPTAEGKKSKFMSKQQVYSEYKIGRTLADRAIRNGSLPLSHIQGRDCVLRSDYEAFLKTVIKI